MKKVIKMKSNKIVRPEYEEDEIIPAITLQLDCYTDELSPAQLAAYQKAEKEHSEIRSKLNAVVKNSENIFAGEIFEAYQLSGAAPPSLSKISKPISELKNALLEDDKPLARGSRTTARGDITKKRTYQELDLDDYEDDDYLPLSKRSAKYKEKEKTKELVKISPAPKETVTKNSKKGSKNTNATTATPDKIPQNFSSNVRPSESTAVGGLAVGADAPTKKGGVVDLTSEEAGAASSSKVAADSREISFNKLQGKTFPSLVVVARPCLKVKDNAPSDRGTLDSRVKNVLMHTATKFTEWLIQQGLVRSEQTCLNHIGENLKLGMYSDATKFPYSGGYVWISDCCQSRFVSVFNGSLFEGSPHPPSVLLKLIYHWACQTNVQNVVQWVKVDNLFVKGLYTWLRAVCTVALHQHMTLLGGAGRRIEVGVISLGTTTQDGQQRQVKVEVLGVLDPEGKLVRLRAVEPLSDGERNYKKRFSKILEPLTSWVHKDSIILTDLTVDKGTLISMGYKTVHQVSSSDSQSRNTNCHIMDYLRRIVPRMFQNTLSLLSRQIIQQFLDELVWREWYGVSPGQAFDNVVSHIAEQTRLDNKDTLVTRLNRVAANPFKNWSHLSVKASAPKDNKEAVTEISPSTSSGKRNRKRVTKEPSTEPESPPPPPKKVDKRAAEKKSSDKKGVIEKKESNSKKDNVPAKKADRKPQKKESQEDLISLEEFYYGILDDVTTVDKKEENFSVQCTECNVEFTSNTLFLNHVFSHANPTNDEENHQCQYCLENWVSDEALRKHTLLNHPTETKNIISSTYNCIICENRFSTIPMLGGHMQKYHVPTELPYKCCACNFMSSSQHRTVDHFYEKHCNSNILQCPFCLKGNIIYKNGEMIIENIKSFIIHLRRHLNKSQCKKCNRCSLWFMHKGALKTHQIVAHVSFSYREADIKPLCDTSAKIFKPKIIIKNFNQKDLQTYKVIDSVIRVNAFMDDGLFCLECGTNFDDSQHLMGLMKCHKCNYKTYCLPTMLDHTSICTGGFLPETSATSTLEVEMHCICGFSSSDGNALARHLTTCERRSAYPSIESVQENTVKRNMLDMLGLVRRADETDNEVNLHEGDTNIDSLIPETTENQQAVAPQEQQQFDESADIMDSGEQRFNTQISLDDLGPPSVLPPASEPDRTPQLKEYQSLATPHVPRIEQGNIERNEYENNIQSEQVPSSEFENL